MEGITKIPHHVAIIMDGNGRWALKQGKPRVEGHFQGVESVRKTIKAALRYGVDILTLYVFSAENWGRPEEEVSALMELLCRSIINETDELVAEGVRVTTIGDRGSMPSNVISHLREIEERTSGGDKLTLVLALNYGSRNEITTTFNKLYSELSKKETGTVEITPEMISANLYTASIPDPDLIIRTGGDYRLSNFLLWQAAYSELYFTDTHWPDFDSDCFALALRDFSMRERRFGLINEKA